MADRSHLKMVSLDLPFQSRAERVQGEISRHIHIFAPEDKGKIQMEDGKCIESLDCEHRQSLL